MNARQLLEWDDVEIPARGTGYHVVTENGRLVDIAKGRTAAGAARSHAGEGAAIVPALYDHHHHIMAAVARQWSCDIADCPDMATAAMRMTSVAAVPDGVLRVVGYDEAKHGTWTRDTLDFLTKRPLKVQHRSGHMWVLNSAALARRSVRGRLPKDGLFYNEDPRLEGDRPSWEEFRAGIAAHVTALQARGVAGCTDMTAHLSSEDWEQVQHVLPPDFMAIAAGDPDKGLPRSKIIIAEHDLPSLDELQALAARLATRELVAVHAVTYEALVLAAVGMGGLGRKLRIEHAFLIDDGMIDLVSAQGASIGVQPSFIHAQGDRLLRQLAPSEIVDYQPLRRLHAAGLRLFGGTDAPFAPADPWIAMQAAVRRRTRNGRVLNSGEMLHPNHAFAMFTRNGLCGDVGPPDLCSQSDHGVILLDRPWKDACVDFEKVRVIARAFPSHDAVRCEEYTPHLFES